MTRDMIRSHAASLGLVTSEDIMEAAGISYRQVVYWCRTGLLEYEEGDGSGTQRMYAPREIMVAELLGRASRAGLLVNSDLGRKVALAVRGGAIGVITDGPLSVFLA